MPKTPPDSDGLEHGGAVDAAAARYAIPRERWLDLSTGVNPRPYPLPDVPAASWSRLPDSGCDLALCRAAAHYYGVGDPACVVPGPGTQALIQWLPRLRPPARVAILGPTYEEHAAAWAAAGHTTVTVNDETSSGDYDVVVTVNPNNPDGRRLEPGQVLNLRHRLGSKGTLLVVDEAFADVAPEVSLADKTGDSAIVVLRSFGKFFGLAGLRLGFALMPAGDARALRRALGPWAVSGPAAVIGARALGDDAWIASSRDRLTSDAARLDVLLQGHGLAIRGGTSLFRLAEIDEAPDLFDHLARDAIMTRRFSQAPMWLRFGIPGSEADFRRLSESLASWAAANMGTKEAAAPCA